MGEAKRRAEQEAAANEPEAIAERWRKALGQGLLIGTPIFGGTPMAEYLAACEQLMHLAGAHDLPIGHCRLTSESLVPRARNYIARDFLESGMEWLLFIDADIVFTPGDVLALLETKHLVVGGAYPRKQIEWGEVIDAARQGNADPAAWSSSYVVNLLPEDAAEGAVTFDDKGCVEVTDLPTGFLLIHRSVLHRIREEVPKHSAAALALIEEQITNGEIGLSLSGGASLPEERAAVAHAIEWVKSTLPRLEYVDDAGLKRPMWNFFPIPVAFEGGRWRLLSEDYAFCRMWQSIGGKCFLHPQLELHHVGRHVFRAHKDRIFEGAIK